MVTPRHQSILESVANGEVRFGTHFNGFYYNHVLQFELAAEDQAYLRALYAAGEIWHKPIDAFDFEVQLRERDNVGADDADPDAMGDATA
jgi:hypothetical protein